jgi:predicted extracellular nuclease
VNFRHRFLTGLAAAGALALGAPAAHAATPVFINEIHYDNVGADVGEAIEIAGPAGTSLTGWSVVLYNGSNGQSYGSRPLTGTLADQGAGIGTAKLDYPADGIQNGSPDAMALVDPTGAVRQFLSYEGTFQAVGGPADGLTSQDIGVAETSSTPVGHSLQLRGTGRTAEDFTWAAASASSFGAPNAGQSFGTVTQPEPEPDRCQSTVTAIPAIQGSGAQSSRVGETVTVRGVVTGDFQAGLGGFFIQDPAGDGDPATSDGLFIFTNTPDVAVGQVVAATGTVFEFARSGSPGP